MNQSTPAAGNRLILAALGAGCLLVGLAGGWLWNARLAGPGEASPAERARIEAVVRDYVLTHPEILPEAMKNLERRENAKALGSVRAEVEKPFPGAVLGNPAGKVTLVVFSDYACTYCRQSVADVEALVRANPDLRVVVRELPIIAPQSYEAARWALAAGEQGRYAAFHAAMFAAGRPDAATLEKVAVAVGVDVARLKAALADPRFGAELERNLGYARQLGFNGTPSWVIGEQILAGAIGRDALQQAVDAARKQGS